MLNIKDLVRYALQEDLNDMGDITTDSLKIASKQNTAKIITREKGVISGVKVAMEVFKQVDQNLKIEIIKKDGSKVKKGDTILKIRGNSQSILNAERTALNFLQRLCGVATTTAKYSNKLQHTKVYDTRKTSPLFRVLEKKAVKDGGGENHRMGLFDQILIKENHIKATGGVKNALRKAKEKYPDVIIEIEVENIKEFKDVLSEDKADIIMLDNMTTKDIKECIKIAKEADKKPDLEVSGGVNLENITDFDIEGVARIAIGALTHSVKSLDLSLLFL